MPKPAAAVGNGSRVQRVRIRGAGSSDIAAIVAVVNSAFAIETFINGTRTDAQQIAEMMQKGEFLVAEGRGIAACVYVERRGNRGYFGMLAVDPARQSKGLGKMMIEAAEQRTRKNGCADMDIWVLSLRPELLPFYQKLGYIQTGRQELPPSAPLKSGVACHIIVMSKKL